MVSTIESPKAAIIYDSLFGFGLIEGAGVGLELDEGEGFGTGERTTDVLISLGDSEGIGFEIAVF
jgi:hypothetical protein